MLQARERGSAISPAAVGADLVVEPNLAAIVISQVLAPCPHPTTRALLSHIHPRVHPIASNLMIVGDRWLRSGATSGVTSPYVCDVLRIWKSEQTMYFDVLVASADLNYSPAGCNCATKRRM